jgi:hypothetical protein
VLLAQGTIPFLAGRVKRDCRVPSGGAAPRLYNNSDAVGHCDGSERTSVARKIFCGITARR